MKKMYALIFLVIFIAVVFASCLPYKKELDLTLKSDNGNMSQGQQEMPQEIPQQTQMYENVTNEQGNTVTVPVPAPTVTAPDGSGLPGPGNEYDILISGKFYMKGTMIESSGKVTPMEVAIGDDTVYMLSDFEGKNMGVLVGKQMYMIYPEQKCYLEISKTLMKTIGQDPDELIDVNSIKVFDGDPLSEADEKKQETLNGHDCSVYIFKLKSGGEKRIYMDGSKLVRFADFKGGKMTSAYDFDFVTGNLPADKVAPPAGYTKYSGLTGALKFMTLIDPETEE